MKRKWLAAICLLMVAALLTACSSGQPQANQTFTEVTQYLGPTATASPVPVNNDASGESDGSTDAGNSVFSENPYMPTDDQSTLAQTALNEEELQTDDTGNATLDQAAADATVYPYAGSTPIPLDPVDAPTATPKPTLTFTYVDYSAAKLGVSFKGPAGWVTDDSADNVFTLSEPSEQIKDGQACVLNIYAVPVSSNYSESDLVTEIKQRLTTISESGYSEWKPSYTATRFLLGSKGVYANFTGTLLDGTQVGGRIHAVCVDKVLYCLQITYPLGYKDDYLSAFSQLRESFKRTNN
jgi:hypothetical protein